MLLDLSKKLDSWINSENKSRFDQGAAPIEKCSLYVIGQTALLEAKLGIQLAATMDVDLYKQVHGEVRSQLEHLLKSYGKTLDPVGHEAWMPKETEFTSLYKGNFVHCLVAKPEYILISKAKMDLRKNRSLLIEYLASSGSKLFEDLAKKYEIDFESILASES